MQELGVRGARVAYVAEDVTTGRRVALKVLRPDCATAPAVIARFWHEARVVSGLRHPNLVPLLDVGFDTPSDAAFLVEERVVGDTLDAALARAPGPAARPRPAAAGAAPRHTVVRAVATSRGAPLRASAGAFGATGTTLGVLLRPREVSVVAPASERPYAPSEDHTP